MPTIFEQRPILRSLNRFNLRKGKTKEIKKVRLKSNQIQIDEQTSYRCCRKRNEIKLILNQKSLRRTIYYRHVIFDKI
jgi:hypothetical protein